MEKLLTIGDLAELLQVSHRTLYNRRQRAPGSLPPWSALPAPTCCAGAQRRWGTGWKRYFSCWSAERHRQNPSGNGDWRRRHSAARHKGGDLAPMKSFKSDRLLQASSMSVHISTITDRPTLY